jgi:hypothetical protein
MQAANKLCIAQTCAFQHVACRLILSDFIAPLGLANERGWQLFNHIRDFCTDKAKDVMFTKPSVPLEKNCHF